MQLSAGFRNRFRIHATMVRPLDCWRKPCQFINFFHQPAFALETPVPYRLLVESPQVHVAYRLTNCQRTQPKLMGQQFTRQPWCTYEFYIVLHSFWLANCMPHMQFYNTAQKRDEPALSVVQNG